MLKTFVRCCLKDFRATHAQIRREVWLKGTLGVVRLKGVKLHPGYRNPRKGPPKGGRRNPRKGLLKGSKGVNLPPGRRNHWKGPLKGGKIRKFSLAEFIDFRA